MATTHPIGTPFACYLVIATDAVGRVISTTGYSARPFVAQVSPVILSRDRDVHLADVILDHTSLVVQEAEAVRLTDGTYRVLGTTITLTTPPATTDTAILADFRASLASDPTAQATLDSIAEYLP